MSSALKSDFLLLLQILKPHLGSHSSQTGSFEADSRGSVGQLDGGTDAPHPHPQLSSTVAFGQLADVFLSGQSRVVSTQLEHGELRPHPPHPPQTSSVPKCTRSGVRGSGEASTSALVPGVPRRWGSGATRLSSPCLGPKAAGPAWSRCVPWRWEGTRWAVPAHWAAAAGLQCVGFSPTSVLPGTQVSLFLLYLGTKDIEGALRVLTMWTPNETALIGRHQPTVHLWVSTVWDS